MRGCPRWHASFLSVPDCLQREKLTIFIFVHVTTVLVGVVLSFIGELGVASKRDGS